ncbi:uncharacterized protein C6orf118-like [Embiotoca jacksoni]|uniref:uncharacterized protein C6orf118-like n=1 Tax=Embiotoca jacksoni TaxID=100190 RepID=UPI00370496EE
MSSSWKPKPKPTPGSFRSDIRRLLLAAEAGQKADILTYSSGHLGPRSLNQSRSHRESQQVFWRMSQNQEDTPNFQILQKRQTKEAADVEKTETKESPSELTSGSALEEFGVLGLRQGQTTDHALHADIREYICLPRIKPLLVQPKACSQKKSNSSSDPEGKHPFFSSQSDQEGLNNEGKKQRFGRHVIVKHHLCAGINVAEIHERKLQKELNKLSAQSWPSRDRLAVFSDVFDDVCEGSPVFGRILREIKTDYDLYINHLMASQSLLENMFLNVLPTDLDNGKVRKMGLNDAEKEVCRLEQEARQALEENKRVQNELQNIPASLRPEDIDMKSKSLCVWTDISPSGLQDSGTAIGCADSIQFKRIQVLSAWKEIQELEEEIKEKLVSTVTTTATERRIKDRKTEIMKLIASNERLRIINKDLENNINVVLNREKAGKAIRRMLWDQINCDVLTKSE